MKVVTQSSTADLSTVNGESISEYTQFSSRYDSETATIWCWMHPEPRPCINDRLIDELMLLQQQLTRTYKNEYSARPFNHLVLASKTPGIYNLGGDLELIRQYIVNKEIDKLRDYAYRAIDLVHNNINNLDLPITMMSLVQGQALGAGFEAALSCDVIIAERHSQLGFPEILFNMFPGMGAYNLLARRTGSALAERLILSGKIYSAGELYDMGVIDVLVEDGEGEEATEKYLKSYILSSNTRRSIRKVRQIVHPITRQSLYEIVNIWLETAMDLGDKDLAKMERLLYLQKSFKDSKTIKENDISLTQRRSDWRKISNVDFPLTTHLGERIVEDRRKNNERRKLSLQEYN
ncbi:MAG: crotonase/enoyl-CoA hydratase family protein [Gammaproteobacteria bacterium]|nr:crotonase/enoyl-CoA hydratase family protein [Gammaproteobacteria bacterium]